ncbi:phage head-tail adapter protein [Pseudomonas fluorescens]|uniref:phage head-tail adapter protein n=1 Tax=Pseudomonas fluorescens TaxID=294 RepID=UPI0010CF506C|nr:phage head-tail adapter protein [Pseudomonas fluorescens]TCV62720.1 hypothetical protein EDB98_11228 [Pseudomonas fluorescens]
MLNTFITSAGETLTLDLNQTGHTLITGTSGKGKSLFTERAKREARAAGRLFVDVKAYRDEKGSGLGPYEYEIARRHSKGLAGNLPRALRKKRYTISSPVAYTDVPSRRSRHLVRTTNGALLSRELVHQAKEQLESISGIRLNQPQLLELMIENGIDKTLAEFNEAETQIREMLADALARKLVGRPWPTHGDEPGAGDFNVHLDRAAQNYGYTVLNR